MTNPGSSSIPNMSNKWTNPMEQISGVIKGKLCKMKILLVLYDKMYSACFSFCTHISLNVGLLLKSKTVHTIKGKTSEKI